MVMGSESSARVMTLALDSDPIFQRLARQFRIDA
jgi:hypothetical protein